MTVATKVLPAAPGLPHPLGRHVEHDDRSRAFAHPTTPAPSHPVLWSHHGAVLDQGQLGSCTGNALTQVLVTGPLHRTGWGASERKAVRVYELATQLDGIPGGYPPDDTGSSGLGVCKAGVVLGWLSGYQHAFGIDHAKAVIATTPFLVGTAWHQDMFTPDPTGFIHPTGPVVGGHEYVCLGWDPASGMWTFLNSWGHWGIGIKGVATTGLFHMTTTAFTALLDDQGDITIPVRT